MEFSEHKKMDHYLVRARKGDVRAFKSVYSFYAKNMLIYCRSFVHDMSLAEDILQESFIKAWNKITDLKDNRSFGAWLKTIVRNSAINAIRSKKITLEFVDQVPETIEEDSFEKPDLDLLRYQINRLPSGCQAVLKLHVYEGLTHEEIADYLDISTSGSKSQFRYALRLLKQSMVKNIK